MKEAARFGPNAENNNRGFMGYSDLGKTNTDFTRVWFMSLERLVLACQLVVLASP